MRRVALYGIGWVAAAAVAILLAWQGVGLVGRNVTDSHPRALTADEARRALEEGSTTTTTITIVTTATQPQPTATTATTRPRPSSSTSPTTAPSGATTSPPSTTAGVVRTYNLVGGSTAVRFGSGAVTVVWANPNPGYRADIDDRDGGGVRVRFDGDSGRSQVEAWWDGGPQDRVEEQGDDDGGSGRG